MKIIKIIKIISALLVVISIPVIAGTGGGSTQPPLYANKDACSSQVKGYVAGLEVGSTLAAINKVQHDKAIKQIEYIKTLQKTLPDCKVVDFIPKLKASKEALKFASEQVSPQG